MKRTTYDTQIAILQNEAFLNGGICPVLPSDKHLAHAREHIKPLTEMYEQAQAGQMSLADAAMNYSDLFAHTVEHVDLIQGDISASEEAAAMEQMLQRIEEVISNGMKEAEKLAQEQAGEVAATEGGEMSVEQQERFAKAQAEVELMKMKTRAGIENEQEKTRARIAMDDAKAAADIRRKGLGAR